MAKVNGLSQADLSAYLLISQRRDVWLNLSNAKSGSEHSGKHSGRPITEHNGGIPSILGDSQRFFSGIADFDSFISELGLSDSKKFKQFVDELRRSRKDAEWLAEIAFTKELTTTHYPLPTKSCGPDRNRTCILSSGDLRSIHSTTGPSQKKPI